MQKTLNLVNAPAGRRLTAWLIDQVIPAVAVCIVDAVTFPAVLAGSTVHVGDRSFTVPAA